MRKFIEVTFRSVETGNPRKTIVPVKSIISIIGDKEPVYMTIKNGNEKPYVIKVLDPYESIRAKLDLVEAPEPIPRTEQTIYGTSGQL